MTTSNPVITHLKQNSSRISRMLTVGQKSSQAQTAGDLSPIASNFGGQKFQLAAQKMRVLDLQKMGRNLPGQKHTPQIGTEIQARFADSAGLLHLSARPTGSDGNWARVNMVYPRTNPVERPQVPDEPGILRQGSVIQKFSPFPAPGQTVESFKAQVQRDSPARIVSTRKPTTPPPAQIGPRDRLFSRVQEITPDSKEPEPPPSGSADVETNAADAAENSKSPSSSQVAPAGGPAVQRQADPAATQPKPAEAGKITRESLEPDAASTIDDQPLPALPDSGTVAPIAAETKTSAAESQLPLARAVLGLGVHSSQFVAPAPDQKDLALAKPVQKKSQAKPVSSNLPQAKSTRAFKTAKQLESAAQRLPIARPTSVSDSGISSQAIVQRQAEMSSPTSSAQPTRRLVEARPQPDRATRQPVARDADSAPASTPDRTLASPESGPAQEVDRLEAQPLHQRFEYRRLVSSRLKAIQPAESFVAPRANPLVNRTDQPLIASYKHFSSEGQAVSSSSGERTFLSRPTPPRLDLVSPASRPPQDRLDSHQPESRPFFESQAKSEQPQTALRSFSTLDLAAQPNPMELARTDQAPVLDAAHSSISLSNDPNPSLLEMTKPALANRAVAPTDKSQVAQKNGLSNVVQRVWDKHDELENIQPKPGPSIDELAEKILPLVKRMMAVEIERSGSLFR